MCVTLARQHGGRLLCWSPVSTAGVLLGGRQAIVGWGATGGCPYRAGILDDVGEAASRLRVWVCFLVKTKTTLGMTYDKKCLCVVALSKALLL
jgi:hypothetical protein